MKIPIKKIRDGAFVPVRAKESDAGYDLIATEPIVIQPFERVLVKTGIQIAIPDGYYGRIAPKSGLAWKKGVDILAGVIDSGYRGEVGVLIINLNWSWKDFLGLLVPDLVRDMLGHPNRVEFKPGEFVAQIIIEPCAQVEWEEVNELPESERGQGGYGHSGAGVTR
jgi:dUTP pyrophosphatase